MIFSTHIRTFRLPRFCVESLSHTVTENFDTKTPQKSLRKQHFIGLLLERGRGGVTLSAIRWLLLDRLHQWTGIKRLQLNLGNLEDRLQSFERVVEDHYRYYEFYGGMLIAAFFSYFLWRLRQVGVSFSIYDFAFLIIEVVFVAASRDALRNYYKRAARILGTLERV